MIKGSSRDQYEALARGRRTLWYLQARLEVALALALPREVALPLALAEADEDVAATGEL